MKSYTTLISETGTLINKTDSTTQATIGQYLNDGQRILLSMPMNWGFLDSVGSGTTIASQQFYPLPYNVDKVQTVTIQSASYLWRPVEVTSRQNWDMLNISTVPTADMVQYFYIYAGQIGFWPKPASTGLTITYNYKKGVKDFNVADYTTGNISDIPYTTTFTAIVASGATSATLSGAWGLTTGSYQIIFSSGEVRPVTLTNGSTAVSWSTALTSAATATITVNNSIGGSILTGSGTTFTAAMVGRYFKINADGYWYQVYSFIDATHISLAKAYSGTAISAGSSAYTIGDMPTIPEAYHIGLEWYAAAQYWKSNGNPDRAQQYDTLWENLKEQMKSDQGDKTANVVIDEQIIRRNPNLYVML